MANTSHPTLSPPTTLQDDPLDPTLAALSTLSLLNLRLSRLEHLLAGHTAVHSDNDINNAASEPSSSSFIKPQTESNPRQRHNTIPSQLHYLETRLSDLKRMDGLPGSLIRMVDTLRREYPEIFAISASTSTTSTAPSSHSLSQQATAVLAHASLYTSTSSRLQTLQTLRIPDATVSAGIMEQGGRMKSLLERQETLEERAAELQRRSVAVLEWWVNVGIKGMGELWEDWEDRFAVCERFVGLYERRAKEMRGEDE